MNCAGGCPNATVTLAPAGRVRKLRRQRIADQELPRSQIEIQPPTFLRFEAEGDPRYWLVLAAGPTATLRHIDALLRDVWLECCGHMSAFFFGRREIAMKTFARDVFMESSMKIRYEYDFGSTTSLVGRRLNSGSRAIPGGLARLLARNEPLQWPCARCTEPATTVCPFCLDEHGLLCTTHADEHEHADEEAYLPVVNSPRMGVCGYTG